jgi:hypothetical protein
MTPTHEDDPPMTWTDYIDVASERLEQVGRTCTNSDTVTENFWRIQLLDRAVEAIAEANRGPFGLAWRLQRTGLIAWAVALFILGISYGSVLGEIERFFECT